MESYASMISGVRLVLRIVPHQLGKSVREFVLVGTACAIRIDESGGLQFGQTVYADGKSAVSA